MSRTKGSKNKPKFQQLTLDGAVEALAITSEALNAPARAFADMNKKFDLAANALSETITSKFIEDEVTTMMKDMHHIVQKVNVETLPKAEEYLRAWFDKGYELTQVIFLGIEDAGATYALMYILVKRE